jgi:circadian clock protein KaiB
MDIIRLYVVGRNAKLNEAVEKFRNFLNQNTITHHEFEIIDVLENPAAADDDKVFATPTMIRVSQNQSKRIIGDISDPEKMAALLGLL